jgi:hypothetical protein
MQARGKVTNVSFVLVAAMSVALAADGTALADTPETMDVTFVEHATTDTVIDLGEEGDSLGDTLAFGNELYDAENTAVVGSSQGQCFRSVPSVVWECTWTNILEDGSITVQGPFYDDLRDVELAITGGTGAYAGASGTMTLHARDAVGSELDFTFRILVDNDDDSDDEDDDSDDADDSDDEDH